MLNSSSKYVRGGSDYIFCGVDLKPMLPMALALSTVAGALCMMLVQIPILSRFTCLRQVGIALGLTGPSSSRRWPLWH